MPGLYDLNSKAPRRAGMTRSGYSYSGHLLESAQPPKEKTKRPSPPFDAPPEGSSDEESEKKKDTEEEANNISSDDSLPGAIKKKRKSPTVPILEKRLNSQSPKPEDPRYSEDPYKDPADIHPSKFAQNKSSGSRNDSQWRRRGSSDVMEEDQEPFGSMTCSQPKRVKKGVTYGVPHNIHLPAPGKESEVDSKKAIPSKARKGRSGFRTVDTTEMLAKADEFDATKEGSTFRKPSSGETTPRSQRASQRSSRNGQQSPQGSQKPSFKAPKRLSPKKSTPTKEVVRLEFNIPTGASEVVDAPRATRISAPAKKPLMFADLNALNTNANALDVTYLQNLVEQAKDNHDVPDLQNKSLFSSSTASSLPLASFDIADQSSRHSSPPRSQSTATCPLCKEPVDKSFLKEYAAGKRLNIRQQAWFCKAHQIRTANAEWREKGYPDIDWLHFNDRLLSYHSAIDNILQGRRLSYYRNAFEDLIKSGKNRTLQQTMMSGNSIEGQYPGYYGSRGARVMVENIMSKFASKIRRLAASDKLISAGGVSGYVQAVLVPELAVLLVMDDLRCDEEKAREVLRESVDIGNLLNEEEDEVIRDTDPDENKVVNVT